jgi:CHASE3 domain sensor protein
MNFMQTVIYFVLVFVLTFVVSAVVTFLYALIAHGTGVVDWETAFALAAILGIVLTMVRFQEQKRPAGHEDKV